MTSHPLRIALDADGVLVDYNRGYARVWERAFGQVPRELNPRAYWATKRFDVRWLEGEERTHFNTFFDDGFWRSLPAMPGAVEATQLLHAHGFELVCVSALPTIHGNARLANLRALGMPIDRVYACPRESDKNPKIQTLVDLAPVAFVDDYYPYLRGVPDTMHRALLLRDPEGSPNVDLDPAHVCSTHNDLLEFARWWVARPQLEPSAAPTTIRR